MAFGRIGSFGGGCDARRPTDLARTQFEQQNVVVARPRRCLR
jgi:hypothetical protein